MRASLRRITVALLFIPAVTFALPSKAEPANRFAGTFAGQKSDFDDYLRELDGFGEARGADRASRSLERPTPWAMYGRIGVLHFQNQLGPEHVAAAKFGFKRTGPALTGKIYVGIHRRW
jgi:hypothetical protein